MKNAICVLFLFVSIVHAHFQVIYTPQTQTSDKTLAIIFFFTHPFTVEPLLRTGLQEDGKELGMKDVFIVHREKTSHCTDLLKPAAISTPHGSGEAQKLVLDQASGYKSAGDYAVIVVPYPYWEVSEKTYIQQIAKLFVNKGGFSTNWSHRCAKGFAEIVPLVKPGEVVPGGLVRAVVFDAAGNVVPYCTVEIEIVNAEIDMAANRIAEIGKIAGEKYGTATVLTDAKGVFEYIPQTPGFWGFAAIGAGNAKTWKGKPLEQDPVLWIQVAK